MTEKEKLDAGLLYDANYDEELWKERIRCKTLCQQFNQLPYASMKEKDLLIKQIFGKTGEQIFIEPVFWCDYGYRIEVGDRFYANHGLVILDAGRVRFGHDVFIGPNCGFHTSGHPKEYEIRNAGLEYALPISVGNNVWIDAGVQVLPGVTIGDNVIIGAGSVVVKDIPGNCVAAGNPCRVIRSDVKSGGKQMKDLKAEKSDGSIRDGSSIRKGAK